MNLSLSPAARKQKENDALSEERKRLLWIAAFAAALIAVTFLLSYMWTRPEPIKDPTYYTGPIYNHNGDLVSGDGKILKRAPQRPARRSVSVE